MISPGIPVSSTKKADRHNITEILCKVAFNTTPPSNMNSLTKARLSTTLYQELRLNVTTHYISTTRYHASIIYNSLVRTRYQLPVTTHQPCTVHVAKKNYSTCNKIYQASFIYGSLIACLFSYQLRNYLTEDDLMKLTSIIKAVVSMQY